MSVPDGLPLAQRLRDRRVLPLWNGWSYEALFVDDRGSCSISQHPIVEGGFVPERTFHRYRDEQGRMWAVRCPASLTEQEGLRTLNDTPPGSIAMTLSRMADDRRGSKERRERNGDDE